ncbi:MAG TPA: Fe-S cluster assembly protein SufD [Gemmatimonadales bacterium]|jgi:Fe-S cluster assembly protein SufD|nr:Fe-S cluster assembly protein SufD [Gemmatimonadales bacterium]
MVVERYLEAYRAFATNGVSGDLAWLKELREGGIARFGAVGFPTTKQEAWRFTSVAPIADAPFELAAAPRSPLAVLSDIEPHLLGASPRLVFVNGHFTPALSHVTGLPAGVRVQSLARALTEEVDDIRQHLGKYAGFTDRPFAALNTAFVRDGAFVHVPAKHALEEPIQLLFLATGGGGAGGARVVNHPRNLVVVAREARATVVETYAALGEGQGTYWTNAVTEVVVGDGARADCYRVQRESERAFHVAVTEAHQGRDSTVNIHAVAFGGALSRHDIRGTLAGPGGHLILNGLYLLAGEQHADHHTAIEHAAPHCESHEYFNGVLDGRSRGVFNGRIVVHPGAQKTDSKQTNNNLLLSAEAHADSQPQLEIYADDVKCTHGSTVGPLDPKALFYLRSRGLAEAEARQLLTYGFGAEILNRMEIASLRTQLDRIVRARLGE